MLASSLWNYHVSFQAQVQRMQLKTGCTLCLPFKCQYSDFSRSMAAALYTQLNFLNALTQRCVLDLPASTTEWAHPELSNVVWVFQMQWPSKCCWLEQLALVYTPSSLLLSLPILASNLCIFSRSSQSLHVFFQFFTFSIPLDAFSEYLTSMKWKIPTAGLLFPGR